MYKLEYLPVARQDLIDIVLYISQELQNPDAANRLAEKLIETAEKALIFPYGNPSYHPIKPLRHEYRKAILQNYLMFYWIDEEKKLVTVVRVLYAKRNYDQLLE